jgi:phosphoribosylformylglycinamidine synthase
MGHPEKHFGARIETHEMIRGDAALFSESQSRIVLSLKEENIDRLKEIATRHGVSMQIIGAVGGNRLTIQPLVQLPVDELRTIWSTSLASRLK